MKFSKLLIFPVLISLVFLTGCTKDDEPLKELEVTLGSYMFVFPPGFKYETQLDADYWYGSVSNDKIIFTFSHGYLVSSPNEVPDANMEITEEEFEGRFLSIAKPRDSQNGWTSIYITDVKEVSEDDLYSGLLMRVTNLTPEEQELAISIFRTVTKVAPRYD